MDLISFATLRESKAISRIYVTLQMQYITHHPNVDIIAVAAIVRVVSLYHIGFQKIIVNLGFAL